MIYNKKGRYGKIFIVPPFPVTPKRCRTDHSVSLTGDRLCIFGANHPFIPQLPMTSKTVIGGHDQQWNQ